MMTEREIYSGLLALADRCDGRGDGDDAALVRAAADLIASEWPVQD